MTIQIKEGKVTDLINDVHNANQGTDKGKEILNKSIAKSKIGRSVLVDAEGRLIGGNKTKAAILEAGYTDTIEVETDGTKLVVVKRTDLNLADSEPSNPARELAYADNTSALFGIDFDPEVILADQMAGIDFESVGLDEATIAGIIESNDTSWLEDVPSLDDLEEEYGEPQERDFWPYIKVQVSPETKQLWDTLLSSVSTDDEAEKVKILLSRL